MSELQLIILVKLVLSHLLADFFLQPKKWVDHKLKKKFKSQFLYLHAFIAGIVAYLLIADWQAYFVFLVIFISHLLIDGLKSYFKTSPLSIFIVDQFLHFVVLLIVYIYVTNQMWINLADNLLSSEKFWLIILGIVAVTFPVGIFIKIVYQKIGEGINLDELKNAGLWIGIIERIITLILVIVGEYTAIGFLIAAKSFWFGTECKFKKKERDYILIGNLLSYSLAILIGLIIVRAL